METRSVWLVRHGQASFGKSDYDNLSDRGHEQAFLLGRDLAARGVAPDLVLCGSMKRHRQTAAEIAAGAGWTLTDDTTGTDGSTPAAQEDDVLSGHRARAVPRRVDERWDELDHQAMLTAYRPAYRNMLLLKADMMRTLRPHEAFEDMFRRAVDRWTSGEHDDYPESFAEFTARIEGALQDLASGEAKHALVVTSAGPVCWATAALAAAGSLDAWKHFTLAAVNTGVTRLTVDRHGTRVMTFNEHGHLDGPGLTTNR